MLPLLMTSLPKGTHKEFQYVADTEAEARQGVVPTPQMFVAYGVQLIRDFTHPVRWKYVDNSSNPEDDVSRRLSAAGLLQQQCCLNGPEFLGKSF